MAKVILTRDAQDDLLKLPPLLQDECLALLRKLDRVGARLGIPLENKNGKDLAGYYKLYFNHARHRVIYTKAGNMIEITAVSEQLKEVLEVVGIGKRDKEKIYNLVYERIQSKHKSENQP